MTRCDRIRPIPPIRRIGRIHRIGPMAVTPARQPVWVLQMKPRLHMGNGRLNEAVAVDVETTGLSPAYGHRVIEIAAVRISGDGPGETFHSLIDCGRSIPPRAQQVHGITDEMLLGQPAPALVFERFRQFIGESELVAHNAAFDRSFIQHEFGRLGWKFANRMYCTLALSRRVLPGLGNYRLETVFRHLFPGEAEALGLHRARDDAWAAGRIWMAIKSEKGRGKIVALLG